MESSIDVLNSKGKENLRLGTLMTFKQRKVLPFGEFAEEDSWDEKVEDEVKAWKPGKLKSREYTHCFNPMETRAGRMLQR